MLILMNNFVDERNGRELIVAAGLLCDVDGGNHSPVSTYDDRFVVHLAALVHPHSLSLRLHGVVQLRVG